MARPRLLVACVLVLLSGCGTLSQASRSGVPVPLGGVRTDLAALGRALDLTALQPGEPTCGGMGPLVAPIPLLDLPLSAAVDVALLPVCGLLELQRALSPVPMPRGTANPYAPAAR